MPRLAWLTSRILTLILSSQHAKVGSDWGSFVMAQARILLVVLAAAVTIVLTAPASAGAAPVKVDATLTGTITGGTIWCCGSVSEFDGKAVLPSIGTVSFSGTWTRGCQGPAFPTTVCFRSLMLTLIAPNGDELMLAGYNEWVFPLEPPPEQLTWSITGGTGRFADSSGSGTYTVEQADFSTLTISLSGTLRP